MVSISKQALLTTHAFEKQSEYLGSGMTAKQRHSALGPLPARPLGVEFVHCDGNITAPPAREQVTPAAAWEPGDTAASTKPEPNGIKGDEFGRNVQLRVTPEFLLIGKNLLTQFVFLSW